MSFMRTEIDQLETPCVIVDIGIAEANIDKFQAYCDAHGIKSRPHIKTHKLPRLAPSTSRGRRGWHYLPENQRG